MSALRKRLRRTKAEEDRGAIAVMFTILLAGGVLMGMLALVIDMGLVYAEKEDLQGGADAAAIALAEGCAAIVSNCGTSVARSNVRNDFVNTNSRDGASKAVFCGGNLAGSGLPQCSGTTRCATDRPTGGQQYIEVETSTELPDGRTALPPVFSAALTGNTDGTTIYACARAQWGTPRFTTRLVISACQYQRALSDGYRLPNRLIDPPPYTADPVGARDREAVLRLSANHDPDNTPVECREDDDEVQRYGYGWLESDEPSDDDCLTDDLDTEYDGRGPGPGPGPGPGRVHDWLERSIPGACRELIGRIAENRDRAEPLTVAIYDRIDIVSGRPKFHVVGMAAFVPTGYWFGGFGRYTSERSWLSGEHVCDGGGGRGSINEQCIYGYFTRVITTGERATVGMRSYGNAVVSLAG